MQLSLRLTTIAGMVTQGNRLVDVGCDHGYLPVYLVLEKRIPSAIAMDVRKGPLSRAQEHIKQYGLADYIETRLSDGLEALKEGEGDTLVIAGMGGPLMERILLDGADVRETFSELILAPQSDIPHFRHFIMEQGWQIVQEEMVQEDGKFYPILKVIHGTGGSWDKEEETFGRLLLERRDPVLKEFLLREQRIQYNIEEKLLAAPEREKIAERLDEVKEEKLLIQAALRRYEGV